MSILEKLFPKLEEILNAVRREYQLDFFLGERENIVECSLVSFISVKPRERNSHNVAPPELTFYKATVYTVMS